MAYRKVDVNIDNCIESMEIISPYINLMAAVFEQTRIDWKKAWNKVSKIGEYYDEEIYIQDVSKLKYLDKKGDEYSMLLRKINIFNSASKDINEIQAFLHSKWLESICGFCNLDIEDVRSEFNKIKISVLS